MTAANPHNESEEGTPAGTGVAQTDTQDGPDVVNAISPGRRKRGITPEAGLKPDIQSEDEAKPDEQDRSSGNRTSPKDGSYEKAGDEPVFDSDDPNSARIRLLLDGLRKQYLQADDKYHFRDRDGTVAFEAQARRLITSHETPAVVSSMIDLAEVKNWSSIKVSGSLAFRQEAWLQASLRDLEVTGHRPSKLDLARLEELRAEFGGDRLRINAVIDRSQGEEAVYSGFAQIEGTKPSETAPKLSEAQEALIVSLEAVMRSRGDSDRAIAMARETATGKLGKGRIHVGEVIGMGTAPYLDKADESESHFVVLKDDKGQSAKIWGVDLPRALEAGDVKAGDKIALAFRGRQMVTVSVKVANENGKGFHFEKRDVERNTWEAVKFDRLRADARAKVIDAVQGTPSKISQGQERPNGASQTKPYRRGRERVR